MAYKTLVMINLGMAIAMFLLRWMILVISQQMVSGNTAGADGPAIFAMVVLGVFMINPVTLVLLIVPGVITICQSARLLEQKMLCANSVWFVLAVLGVVVESLAVLMWLI